MKFTQETDTQGNIIQAYWPGQIVVSGRTLENSLIVTRERLLETWRPRTAAELEADDLICILEFEPEVVLLGTGPKQAFPAPDTLRPILERGIGLEVMDTAAACRTYNILMSEGRRVVAALLMP
ncbi:MAG TPA: hypothetical protein EYH03_04150 [Chromatiales bacterium]|nr:hypothetical protein [Candidatus Micrarchaeota archaeon]HIP53186.1 hypothetical protein [Chromatiales bacterium]